MCPFCCRSTENCHNWAVFWGQQMGHTAHFLHLSPCICPLSALRGPGIKGSSCNWCLSDVNKCMQLKPDAHCSFLFAHVLDLCRYLFIFQRKKLSSLGLFILWTWPNEKQLFLFIYSGKSSLSFRQWSFSL